MSAIQLFDLNGEQRFTGTLVGGGGAQPLADVLAAGNDAGGQSITNLAGLVLIASGTRAITGGGLLSLGSTGDTSVQVNAGSDLNGQAIGDLILTAGVQTGGSSLSLYAGAGQATGQFLGHLQVRNGTIILRLNTAPADADLLNGSCGLWFDQTNGAAKLMAKGKTANGTVVTAVVAGLT